MADRLGTALPTLIREFDSRRSLREHRCGSRLVECRPSVGCAQTPSAWTRRGCGSTPPHLALNECTHLLGVGKLLFTQTTAVRFRLGAPSSIPVSSNGRTAVSGTAYGGSSPSTGAIRVSSNGRTAVFGAAYRGSNPCTRAKPRDAAWVGGLIVDQVLTSSNLVRGAMSRSASRLGRRTLIAETSVQLRYGTQRVFAKTLRSGKSQVEDWRRTRNDEVCATRPASLWKGDEDW